METSGSSAPEDFAGGRNDAGSQKNGEEGVERRLARFAFVREEREREVRLLFQDVPPLEIALAFKAAGATLISMAGERGSPAVSEETASTSDSEPPGDDDRADSAEAGKNSDAKLASEADNNDERAIQSSERTGEITIRYFFDLDEIVYTVSMVVPSGIARSVASVYPLARLAEEEIQKRIGATFA